MIDIKRRQFARNIMDNDEGIWMTGEALDGVPSADLARFRSGSQTDTTKYFVHFTKADIQAVLMYARNPTTRKALYTSANNSLGENVELFKDIIVRRDINARMLGYNSHAAFRLQKRMAKTPCWVHGFLDELQHALLPLGRREMDVLQARKTRYLQESGLTDEYPDIMTPWDLQFYTRVVAEESKVHHETIAEYYPLQNTVSCMLDTFAHCLQLRFEELAPDQIEESTWHEDVNVWCVWDETHESRDDFIGYLYMDLLFRPNKYRRSQDVNLQCVS